MEDVIKAAEDAGKVVGEIYTSEVRQGVLHEAFPPKLENLKILVAYFGTIIHFILWIAFLQLLLFHSITK